MIPAGRMRHRVAVQSPATTVDSYGQPTLTWSTVSTVWAELVGRGGGTQAIVNKGQVTLGHTVRIRYCAAFSTMDETWRLLLGSRVLEISSVNNVDYLNEILELTCSEEVV